MFFYVEKHFYLLKRYYNFQKYRISISFVEFKIQEELCIIQTSFLSTFYLGFSHMETFPEIGLLMLPFLNLVCMAFLCSGQETHITFKTGTCCRFISHTSYSVLSQTFLQLWICVGVYKRENRTKQNQACSPT